MQPEGCESIELPVLTLDTVTGNRYDMRMAIKLSHLTRTALADGIVRAYILDAYLPDSPHVYRWSRRQMIREANALVALGIATPSDFLPRTIHVSEAIPFAPWKPYP